MNKIKQFREILAFVREILVFVILIAVVFFVLFLDYTLRRYNPKIEQLAFEVIANAQKLQVQLSESNLKDCAYDGQIYRVLLLDIAQLNTLLELEPKESGDRIKYLSEAEFSIISLKKFHQKRTQEKKCLTNDDLYFAQETMHSPFYGLIYLKEQNDLKPKGLQLEMVKALATVIK